MLPLERVFECMREAQDREEREQFWRSYMAGVVPLYMAAHGVKNPETYEESWERCERRSHRATREEIEAADEAGRRTAAAFGML